jgi:hypothetical protein
VGSHPERLLVKKKILYISIIIEPGGSVDKPEAENGSNRLVQRMWMGCGQLVCPQPIHILALSPG